MEDNAVGRKDFETAGNKAGLGEAFPCDLAFALTRGGVGPPSDFAGGDILIAGDFGGDPASLCGFNPDDLFKVALVVADPFPLERDGGGIPDGHAENLKRGPPDRNQGARRYAMPNFHGDIFG